MSTPTSSSGITEKPEMNVHINDGGSANGSYNIPARNAAFKPMSRMQTTASLQVDDYFAGPRDMNRHSKVPFFMRVHGSIVPKMILPLLFVGVWSTAITLIHKKVHQISEYFDGQCVIC